MTDLLFDRTKANGLQRYRRLRRNLSRAFGRTRLP
jgi:hypothetical protein